MREGLSRRSRCSFSLSRSRPGTERERPFDLSAVISPVPACACCSGSCVPAHTRLGGMGFIIYPDLKPE